MAPSSVWLGGLFPLRTSCQRQAGGRCAAGTVAAQPLGCVTVLELSIPCAMFSCQEWWVPAHATDGTTSQTEIPFFLNRPYIPLEKASEISDGKKHSFMWVEVL